MHWYPSWFTHESLSFVPLPQLAPSLTLTPTLTHSHPLSHCVPLTTAATALSQLCLHPHTSSLSLTCACACPCPCFHYHHHHPTCIHLCPLPCTLNAYPCTHACTWSFGIFSILLSILCISISLCRNSGRWEYTSCKTSTHKVFVSRM